MHRAGGTYQHLHHPVESHLRPAGASWLTVGTQVLIALSDCSRAAAEATARVAGFLWRFREGCLGFVSKGEANYMLVVLISHNIYKLISLDPLVEGLVYFVCNAEGE